MAQFLHAYREVGVREFVLMPLGSRPVEQVERLADVVTLLRSSEAIEVDG